MIGKISVLILTHNAPRYVEETIVTLNEVTRPEERNIMEIIVFDNASDEETKRILYGLKERGYIDKLQLSEINTLFSLGNNLASNLASKESNFLLLLNSDIKINHPDWLYQLLKYKKTGNYNVISYGYAGGPSRCDGYCFLIDKNLYDTYKLDESFEWWWGITKIQAELLKDGYSILAIKNHNKYLYHYGGKSGLDFDKAKGMNTEIKEVLSWFQNNTIEVFDLCIIQTITENIRKIIRRAIKILK